MEILQTLFNYFQDEIVDKEFSNLAELSVDDLCESITLWQQAIVDKFKLSAEVRLIDPDVIDTLLDLSTQDDIALTMRHGEQLLGDDVAKLENAALKKIMMMRHEHNVKDPITVQSAIEFLGTMSCFAYICAQTNKRFHIETSANQRALIPANAISETLNVACNQNEIWDCIDYPSEDIITDDELLKLLPTGSVPWKKNIFDQVSLERSYEAIQGEVTEFHQKQDRPANTMTLVITHTQQINATAECNDLPVERLGYYGFTLSGEKTTPALFRQGIYKNETVALNPTPSHVEGLNVTPE